MITGSKRALAVWSKCTCPAGPKGPCPGLCNERRQPGFPEVLETIHRVWTERRPDVLNIAARLQAAIEKSLDQPASQSSQVPVVPGLWNESAVRALLKSYDSRNGGFSARSRIKFPRAPTLELLLAHYSRSGSRPVAKALGGTLDAIALGGIQDHLAGGFHRYSTDPQWSVPHFEKMLYDNAQLLALYAEAYVAFGSPLYRYTAGRIADYLVTRMMAPQGGFYTAEDAQVDGVEGVSYLWTREQIVAVLGADAAARLLDIYTLVPVPHSAAARRAAGRPIPEGGAVLRIRLPAGEAVGKLQHREVVASLKEQAPARAALLAERDKRVAPLRDEKLTVELNGLAIDGFARAARALGEPRYADIARRAAERMWSETFDERSGKLAHQVYRERSSGGGFLADYAQFARGLLSLHSATGEAVWLERAMRLADVVLERYIDDQGGLRFTLHENELPARLQDYGDDDSPSGTSNMMWVLVALAKATGERRYADSAVAHLRRYAPMVGRHPSSWPTFLTSAQMPAAQPMVIAANSPLTVQAEGSTDPQSLPVTANFVRVSTRRDAAASQLVLTIHVVGGYHINANPATLDFLIPTSVAFDGEGPEHIRYPVSKKFKPEFEKTVLDVYQGEATIVATFQRGALARAGAVVVTAQACTDKVCLPPSRIRASEGR